MPIDVKFEPDKSLVVATGRGVVTGEEILRATEEIHALPRYDCQLADFTGVERFEVSADDVERFAAQDRAAVVVNPNLRVAVAGNKDIVFGMARMWEAVVGDSSISTRVVRTLEEARRWMEEG